MGGGSYNSSSRAARSRKLGYHTKSAEQIFEQRHIHESMNPKNALLRESRDSEEHPESVAIILGLDVTGSMGRLPHMLVKDGLPHIMEKIMQKGIADPQVLFLGIGDHTCDDAPLQVGQFESSDDLLDQWLTRVWLEGRGGGNTGESYHLAWYYGAFHTAIDCFEKRNRKGYLITIGDEPVLEKLPGSAVQENMGIDSQIDYYTVEDLVAAARIKYHVSHINVSETFQGSNTQDNARWRDLLGQDFLNVDSWKDIPGLIADRIVENYYTAVKPEDKQEVASREEPKVSEAEKPEESKPITPML
jgi:hypothetical protein